MNQKYDAVGHAAIKRLIAERAYELWENQGRPHGCDLIHWREAEQEIMNCMEKPSHPPGVEPLSQGTARVRAGAVGTVTVREYRTAAWRPVGGWVARHRFRNFAAPESTHSRRPMQCAADSPSWLSGIEH